MRSTIPFLALGLALAAAPALAAPPTGTITCDALTGTMQFKHLPGVANPTPFTSRIPFRMVDGQSSCDSSGVTSDRGPIGSVTVKFFGKLPAGSTCGDLFGTPAFEKAKIKAIWRGGYGNVGSSAAALATASYDTNTGALVFVTQPIARGAFAGSTLTFRMGLASFSDQCQTFDGSFGGLTIGDPFAPASISVP